MEINYASINWHIIDQSFWHTYQDMGVEKGNIYIPEVSQQHHKFHKLIYRDAIPG